MEQTEKYPVNTRIEYAYEPRIIVGDKLLKPGKQHRVGFVKKVARTWWGAKRYLVCCVNRDVRTIDTVKPSDIFGVYVKAVKG